MRYGWLDPALVHDRYPPRIDLLADVLTSKGAQSSSGDLLMVAELGRVLCGDNQGQSRAVPELFEAQRWV